MVNIKDSKEKHSFNNYSIDYTVNQLEIHSIHQPNQSISPYIHPTIPPSLNQFLHTINQSSCQLIQTTLAETQIATFFSASFLCVCSIVHERRKWDNNG